MTNHKYDVGSRVFYFQGVHNTGIYVIDDVLVVVNRGNEPAYILRRGDGKAFADENMVFDRDTVLLAVPEAVARKQFRLGGSDWTQAWWELYEFVEPGGIRFDEWWSAMAKNATISLQEQA